MAAIIQSVQAAVTSVSHEVPPVTQAKKVLLAITSAAPQMPDHKSGYFWAELLHPYETLTKAGYDVDIVSETGSASVDEASVTSMAAGGDKKKWEDKQFPLHAKLAALKKPDQIQLDQYDAIFFAGGHGACDDFPRAAGLQRLASTLYEQGGVVAAVCHGPAIFDGLKLPSTGEPLLKGKRATGFAPSAEKSMGVDKWMAEHGYKDMRQVIEGAGGEWHEHSINPMLSYTEVSGRVVTGMNPASAGAVAEEMIKLLKPQA